MMWWRSWKQIELSVFCFWVTPLVQLLISLVATDGHCVKLGQERSVAEGGRTDRLWSPIWHRGESCFYYVNNIPKVEEMVKSFHQHGLYVSRAKVCATYPRLWRPQRADNSPTLYEHQCPPTSASVEHSFYILKEVGLLVKNRKLKPDTLINIE